MTNEQKQYELWLEKTAGNASAAADLSSIAGDEAEINDRFYRELSFGTAGLRGILGMGTNRMNTYVVGRATQALANYLLASGAKNPAAAIAYDSRNFSYEFARHTACVLAANGIKTYIYKELMPTPALSYAVRELGCDTGVVITASHNPAAYNGYKAYDSAGCQIGSEQADAIQKEILATDLFEGVKTVDFDAALSDGRIEYISDEFVGKYLDCVFGQALEPEVCKKAGLKLVFTPLNGAGNFCVRNILSRLGVTDVTVVPEQEHPDGNFPTCPYPNPETSAALELGVKLCEKTGADLLLATDPDCDRVSVAVRHDGGYRILTGNELGILLLDYICKTRGRLGTLPKSPVAVRSLVSSRMTDEVARSYGVEMRSVLTGFKYIGEVIAGLEAQNRGDSFIFGFEESCGYLSEGYVRDKDAVNASLLTAEMASAAKLEGKTLVDVLENLYQKFGVWRSDVDNFAFEGASGMYAMQGIMEGLSKNPPTEVAGDKVETVLDYQNDPKLPKTNMIELHTGGHNAVIIRPSGTEPKIKVYYTVTGSSHEQARAVSERYRAAMKDIIKA